jgi:acyl carrier protein
MPLDHAEIMRRVWEKAAELSGLPASQIDTEATLESLGLSSSDAVILAMEIEEVTDKPIDVGVFLRHETIAEAIAEIEAALAEGR